MTSKRAGKGQKQIPSAALLNDKQKGRQKTEADCSAALLNDKQKVQAMARQKQILPRSTSLRVLNDKQR